MFDITFVFLSSLVLSIGAVFAVLKFSHHKKWYDRINERKIHEENIPRLGGMGFAFAFFIVIGSYSVFLVINGANLLRFIPSAIAMFIILFSGAVDDFRPLSPLYKLLLQIIAVICIVTADLLFSRIVYEGGGILTNLGFLAFPITIVWILGLTNAFNFIDGVDGLAGGVSAIIALTFGLLFFYFDGTSRAVLFCVSLLGVIIGFLIFNAPLPKAKIFMGDCGSQFLGFTLALLPLMKNPNTTASLPLLYAAAIFLIPIFDTTAAVWRRLRDGRKIYEPDRLHLHHKLMNIGLNAKGVCAVIYSLQITLGALVFIAVHFDGLVSLLVLMAAYLIALSFFTVVHYMNKAIMTKQNSEHGEQERKR